MPLYIVSKEGESIAEGLVTRELGKIAINLLLGGGFNTQLSLLLMGGLVWNVVCMAVITHISNLLKSTQGNYDAYF